MKFDYKPKNKKIGSPIYRRTVHVTMGFAAFVCLTLGLTLGNSNPKVKSESVIQSAGAIQNAGPNVRIADAKKAAVNNVAVKAAQKTAQSTLTTNVAQTIAQPPSSSSAASAVAAKIQKNTVPKPLASKDAIPAAHAEISAYERLIADLPPLEIEGLPKLALHNSQDNGQEELDDSVMLSTQGPEHEHDNVYGSGNIAGQDNAAVEEATGHGGVLGQDNASGQDNALEPRMPEILHNIKVRHKDSLAKICNRLGVSTKDIHEILTTDPESKPLAALQQGQTLKLRVTKDKQIAGLTLDIAPGNSLIVARKDEGFDVEHKVLPLEKHIAFGKGQIRNSLFASAKKAGLDTKLISQMTEIFGSNIDFSLDLQPTDTFRVLYEEKCLNGERIETGHILAAEIVNDGKKHLAIRYTDKSGRTDYFSPDGYGLNLAFLRSPVNYSYITSGFGRRRHPCLHKMRAHKGTDYKAPHGAPVLATGQGKVIFVGNRGGYGKMIKLQHGPRYSTLYAHLSRFAKGLKVGSPVAQGQVIGYVGRTGLATGTHLHYEFLIDEIHHDPTRVTLPRKNPLDEKSKRHFLAHSKEMIRLLDMHDHKVKMALNKMQSNGF